MRDRIFSWNRLCEHICLVLRSSKTVIYHYHLSSRDYWNCLHKRVCFKWRIYNSWWGSLFEVIFNLINFWWGLILLLSLCFSTFRIDFITLFQFWVRSLWIRSSILKCKWIFLPFFWRLMLNCDLFCWNIRFWNHTVFKIWNLFIFDWWSLRVWIRVRHV